MERRVLKKPTEMRKRARLVLSLDKIPYLSATERVRLTYVAAQYPFRATDYYLNLIDWQNPHDPIRRLIIPDPNELGAWGDLDASKEENITVGKGVQHKYSSTVLLLVNEACACFCRYCFRKRLFIDGNDESAYDLSTGLDYIREHPEVNNVLLTGGDPLILPTPKLQRLIEALRAVEHVRVIRIGSKIPAFDPYRIINDNSLVEMLGRYSLPDTNISNVSF